MATKEYLLGNIKGVKGDTGAKGNTGNTGLTGMTGMTGMAPLWRYLYTINFIGSASYLLRACITAKSTNNLVIDTVSIGIAIAAEFLNRRGCIGISTAGQASGVASSGGYPIIGAYASISTTLTFIYSYYTSTSSILTYGTMQATTTSNTITTVGATKEDLLA